MGTHCSTLLVRLACSRSAIIIITITLLGNGGSENCRRKERSKDEVLHNDNWLNMPISKYLLAETKSIKRNWKIPDKD